MVIPKEGELINSLTSIPVRKSGAQEKSADLNYNWIELNVNNAKSIYIIDSNTELPYSTLTHAPNQRETYNQKKIIAVLLLLYFIWFGLVVGSQHDRHSHCGKNTNVNQFGIGSLLKHHFIPFISGFLFACWMFINLIKWNVYMVRLWWAVCSHANPWSLEC